MFRKQFVAMASVVSLCVLTEAVADQPKSEQAGIAAIELRCEMRNDPVGIDSLQPRLSWRLASDERGQFQTAYQILVASDPADLQPGEATVWDSGRVALDRSVHVEYDGRPLRSRERCHWTVRVWDRHGRVSDWSAPAFWEMGLLDDDDWIGQWITDGRAMPERDEDHYADDPAPLMRRTFDVDGDVARARLYISGLGSYEATLNGRPIDDAVLNPLWTAYDKRVFYQVIDVTDQLAQGRNALGVMLGNGWYNPLPLRMWGHLNLREQLVIGRPRLIAQLEVEYADGRRQTVATDGAWKTSPGPIVRNNIYLGEVYDARREQAGWNQAAFDDSNWQRVAVTETGLGPLHAQPLQPIRVTARLEPIAVTEPEPGVFIVDMGQNFTGWVRLAVHGDAGTRVRLRFGELLHDDGRLNPMTSVCGQIKREGTGGPGAPAVAVQEDTYILRGDGPESYTPRFTFHAFRYVEITGFPGTPDPSTIEGLRLTCDVDEVGAFECSNPLLNRIHSMVRWTFLSNLMGVQSDCPHRERFGYGGDIAATCEAFMMNFDMSSFYPKTVVDFMDSTPESGAFPMTAPAVGIAYAGLEDGDAPIGWSIAHPMLLGELHRYYGDLRLIEEHYDAACRWIEYVRVRSPNGIVDRGLSDHETLEPKAVRVTSTGFYLQGVEYVQRMAEVLGREEDVLRYAALARDIRRACASELIDEGSGAVGIGSQAAQAAGFFHRFVPDASRDAAFERLIDPIEADSSMLRTGIFGTLYLLDVLSREGRADLAYALVNRTSFPGWGHMLERGATTLWEHWEFSDNTFSHNHPMFGSVSTWMFHWLVGIEPASDAVGFDQVVIQPQLVPGLTWVRGSYDSIRGPIESAWEVVDDRFRLSIALPPGVRGEVLLPAGCDLQRATVDDSAEVRQLEPGRYRVGSGRYVFIAPMEEH